MRFIAALSLALLMVFAFSDNADARRRQKQKPKLDGVSLLLQKLVAQNEAMAKELDDIKRHLRPDVVAAPADEPQEPVRLGMRELWAPIQIPLAIGKTIQHYADHIAKSAKLKDLTPKLADKTAEILGSCNTHIVSAYRRGARVAGSGRPSLHSIYPSQAVDLVGDPKCIYQHLVKWPGGYSVDYARVHHVHVSLSSSGRERGARFVHYRGGTRYASRRHARHRYAMRPQQYEAGQMHYAAAR